MKIELKNFKHYERLSEETNCFVGNIWVNGIKCGYAENTGKGGCTSYHNEGTQQSRELLKQAEEYCLTLPPIVYKSSISGKNIEIKMNLENFIDELADKMISDAYKQKDAQKMRKNMEKAILIGNDQEYRTIAFKMPLKEVMEKHTDYFKKVLKEKLDKYSKDGYKLLNTNIPQHFLN